MGKLLNSVLMVLLVVGALVVVLKMAGLGDTVDKAAKEIRSRVGGDSGESAVAQQDAGEELAKQVLGFSAKEIDEKPTAVILEAKRKLQKVIDELESQKLGNKIGDTKNSMKLEKLQGELEQLRTTLTMARDILKNEGAIYPAKIGNATYPSREVLVKAVDNARARYQVVSKELSYATSVQVGARDKNLLSENRGKLEAAYALMAVLDAKLMFGENKERSRKLEAADAELSGLAGDTSAILDEEENTILPGQVKSDEDRVMDFLDTL